MEVHMDAKAQIPSPDKYINDLDFLSMSKKMKIYPYDRKTYIMNTINKSKLVPGVAQYDTTKFDEKFNKSKVNVVINNEDRYTKFDEINYLQK